MVIKNVCYVTLLKLVHDQFAGVYYPFYNILFFIFIFKLGWNFPPDTSAKQHLSVPRVFVQRGSTVVDIYIYTDFDILGILPNKTHQLFFK
jgi:hypothetical protein